MTDEAYNAYSILLDRTARRVKQYAQQQFKALKLNITVDQWLILKQLHEHQRMKQHELAEALFKDKPTVTRIIDLLCAKGLTERQVHPEDRRSFFVHLTREGKKKVEYILPKVRNIRLHAWEGLSPKDFAHFKKVLDTIYKNLT